MKPTDKNEKSNLSIRAKIFLGFLFVIFIALVLLWLCQVVLFGRIYVNTRVGEISATARHSLLYADKVSFYSELNASVLKNDICASVLNADGEEIYTVEASASCLIHTFSAKDRQGLIPLSKRDGALYAFTYDTVSEEYSVASITNNFLINNATNALSITEFEHNGETLTLVLDGSILPVGTVTKSSASFLITLTALLIVIAVLLATYISKAIATPIVQISAQAKELSNGDYREVEGGPREVAELNEALSGASRDLKKVDEMRRELIANISHDLRTPLTLISGYAEMMRDLPSEATAENLQIIIDETNRLTSLVNDMLDISRLESGHITPKLLPYSLTDSVKKTVERYNEMSRKDGYTFTFTFQENVSVNADESLILQVLTNLLNNAMTYTGPDKQIHVRQILSEGRVRIEVTDTGDGIEPDKLPLIWERYYKAEDAHKRAVKGTGLGLSIVRSVIDLHNGSYGVRSTPGKGSTFWFELTREA